MFRFAALPLLALLFASAPTQRIESRAVSARLLTDSTALVVTTWRTSRADSVRLTYSTGVARTRAASRGVDSLEVRRTSSAQTVTVTLTPVRGTTVGPLRSSSVTVAARPELPPSVDSLRVDTAAAIASTGSTTAPVVTPPPITGPIGVPTSFTPNLPSGMTLVADSDFDSDDSPGMQIVNWARETVQSPATFGVTRLTTDGRTVLRAWYPERHAGEGVGPMTILTPELRTRAAYMAVRMRYSPGYELHTNTEKLWYPVTTNPQSGSGLLNVHPEMLFVGKDTPFEEVTPAVALSAPGVIPPIGTWFLAEFYVRLNSPGRADGVWKAWINGTLVVSKENYVFFRDVTSQPLFLLGRYDTTRGGGPSPVLTPVGGQWRDLDRLAFYAGN